MITSILGTKMSQTQAFTEDGKRIPVTVITAGPCWVTQIVDNGPTRQYQVAFGNLKHMTKPIEGHLKKAGLTQKPRFLRLLGSQGTDEIQVGHQIRIEDVLAAGDRVRVTGVSKGKGFAGVVKRHGFHGGPRTHGQSDRERAPGSIGSGTTPGRVTKGKRMAGRMGTDKVTVKGLQVVSINSETNTVVISGLVPGARKGLLFIQKEL